MNCTTDSMDKRDVNQNKGDINGNVIIWLHENRTEGYSKYAMNGAPEKYSFRCSEMV